MPFLNPESKAAIEEAVKFLQFIIELSSVLVVGAGFAVAVAALARGALRGNRPGFNVLRLRLSRYLALALELQLGADIIGTAISPTWEQIAELGAIAVIRTGLNFFLGKEMREETELIEEEAALPGPHGADEHLPGGPPTKSVRVTA